MHILIAPNAFKNSLEATKVAEAIERGLQRSKLSCTTTCFPVADGGDGTADLLVQHLSGKRIEQTVHDPLGRIKLSAFGLVDNEKTAIIGMADASGLRLLKKEEYDPLHASSFGTGELMKNAMDIKATKLILCIGGSATVDGGTGILQALGVKFLDAESRELQELPVSLERLSKIETGQLGSIELPEIIILCDVNNPLLGPNGAAAVFGPQKGASENDVKLLESCLSRLRDITLLSTGKDMTTLKYGGAAGGVAATLHTFLNAKLVNGIQYFLEITGFNKQLAKADMVITGEGSLDAQTLQGKGPFGVATEAKKHSIPVIGMAGKISSDKELHEYFDQLISINDEDAPVSEMFAHTYSNLEKKAFLLGNELSITHNR